MFSSTSSALLPQDPIANLHHPRKLLSRFYHTQTIPPVSAPNYQIHPSSWRDGFDANLIMVLAMLLCTLICSFCVNSLIKCMLRCSSFITREPNYYIYRINNHGLDIGVDKGALRTFPVLKYSKDNRKIQVLDSECVICLSEFIKGDRLRILPSCNHGFHVKCIDKWLKSHSSCPTCRQSLVDTCQKMIGFDNHNHNNQATSSSATMDMIAVGIMPLEREDLVRNYRN